MASPASIVGACARTGGGAARMCPIAPALPRSISRVQQLSPFRSSDPPSGGQPKETSCSVPEGPNVAAKRLDPDAWAASRGHGFLPLSWRLRRSLLRDGSNSSGRGSSARGVCPSQMLTRNVYLVSKTARGDSRRITTNSGNSGIITPRVSTPSPKVHRQSSKLIQMPPGLRELRGRSR